MASLESVQAKVARAKQHYIALTSQLNWYFQGKGCDLLLEANLQTNTVRVAGIEAPAIPTVIPLIIGDCLQNLRSALDYLVWELVLAANNKPNKNHAFPICGSPKCFENAKARGRLNGIDARAVALIEALQPYRAGEGRKKETGLWILDELCNINKHRRILLTELTSGFLLDGEAVPQHYAKVTAASGEDMEMDANIVALVVFNEGVVKGADVCSVLDQIAREVWENIAPLFAPFFE